MESAKEEDSRYQFTVKFKSLEFQSLQSVPEAVSVAFVTPSQVPYHTKCYWPSLFMNSKVLFQNESYTNSDDSLNCTLDIYFSDPSEQMKPVERVALDLNCAFKSSEQTVVFENYQIFVTLEIFVSKNRMSTNFD